MYGFCLKKYKYWERLFSVSCKIWPLNELKTKRNSLNRIRSTDSSAGVHYTIAELPCTVACWCFLQGTNLNKKLGTYDLYGKGTRFPLCS